MRKFNNDCIYGPNHNSIVIEHYLFSFDNGFGASVIREKSYSNYEIWFSFHGKFLDFCDPVGDLSPKEVEHILEKNKAILSFIFFLIFI